MQLESGAVIYFIHPICGKRQGFLKEVIRDDKGILYRVQLPGWKNLVNLRNWQGIVVNHDELPPEEPAFVATRNSQPKENKPPIPSVNNALNPYSNKKPCVCGCGGLTGGNFCPGHDARVKSLLERRRGGQQVEIADSVWEFIRKHKSWMEKYGDLL